MRTSFGNRRFFFSQYKDFRVQFKEQGEKYSRLGLFSSKEGGGELGEVNTPYDSIKSLLSRAQIVEKDIFEYESKIMQPIIALSSHSGQPIRDILSMSVTEFFKQMSAYKSYNDKIINKSKK